jgi:hypothetical protein
MIIGICGKAGSGKDTIAEFIQNKYGFSHDWLAAPLKRTVKDLFVLSDDEVYDRELRELPLDDWPDWSVRKLLQFIGTELLRRNIDDMILVRSLCRRLTHRGKTPLNAVGSWIIPDIRLPNEIEMLRKVFGENFVMMKVIRPGYDGKKVGIEGHETEKHDLAADFEFLNDSTKEDLWEKVEAVMEGLLERTQ